MAPASAIRRSFFWILLLTLAVFVGGSILTGLYYGNMVMREEACIINLRQLSLCVANHESAQKRYPGPSITDTAGTPLLSWRVAVLPWMNDTIDIFHRFDQEQAWNSVRNAPLADEMPSVYRCPTDPYEKNQTGYQACVGRGCIFDPESPRGIRVGELTDGTSKTIAIVEACNSRVGWTEPKDLDVTRMSFRIGAGPGELGSNHMEGKVIVGYADGHTQAISKRIDPQILRSLISRNGGECATPCDL